MVRLKKKMCCIYHDIGLHRRDIGKMVLWWLKMLHLFSLINFNMIRVQVVLFVTKTCYCSIFESSKIIICIGDTKGPENDSAKTQHAPLERKMRECWTILSALLSWRWSRHNAALLPVLPDWTGFRPIGLLLFGLDRKKEISRQNLGCLFK